MVIPHLVEFFVIRRFTRIHKGKKLVVEVRNNERSSAREKEEELVATE
jgi:hypothetical protein